MDLNIIDIRQHKSDTYSDIWRWNKDRFDLVADRDKKDHIRKTAWMDVSSEDYIRRHQWDVTSVRDLISDHLNSRRGHSRFIDPRWRVPLVLWNNSKLNNGVSEARDLTVGQTLDMTKTSGRYIAHLEVLFKRYVIEKHVGVKIVFIETILQLN